MGKSKKRILAMGVHQQLSTLSREDAIKVVMGDGLYAEKMNLISLFGITPYELSEAGMSYEDIRKLEGFQWFQG